MTDEIAYARAIGPHVDRLTVAVHRYGRPAGAALLREYGLDDAGILVDARAILLAGPITVDDVAVIDRYAPRDCLAIALEDHVRQNLLEREDTAGQTLYSSTMRGREFLLRLTALQGETITALWAVSAGALAGLAATATSVTDYASAMLPLDRYPAFRGQHAAPAPLGATPAHLLLTRLTTLRYLRADAHALALAAHDVEPAEAGMLTGLWRAEDSGAATDAQGSPDNGGDAWRVLSERGLIARVDSGEGDSWRITATGSTLRDRIEEETDRAAAPPFTVLGERDRASFLSGLEKLPS